MWLISLLEEEMSSLNGHRGQMTSKPPSNEACTHSPAYPIESSTVLCPCLPAVNVLTPHYKADADTTQSSWGCCPPALHSNAEISLVFWAAVHFFYIKEILQHTNNHNGTHDTAWYTGSEVTGDCFEEDVWSRWDHGCWIAFPHTPRWIPSESKSNKNNLYFLELTMITFFGLPIKLGSSSYHLVRTQFIVFSQMYSVRLVTSPAHLWILYLKWQGRYGAATHWHGRVLHYLASRYMACADAPQWQIICSS